MDEADCDDLEGAYVALTEDVARADAPAEDDGHDHGAVGGLQFRRAEL